MIDFALLKMSTEAVLTKLYELCKQVRNSAELGLPVSMNMLLTQFQQISKQINRRNFPSKVLYHVDGLIRYMSHNMEYTKNMQSYRWRFVLQGLETISIIIDEAYYQMNEYALGTNLKPVLLPPTHFAAVSPCDIKKQNKMYRDISEQLRDQEHVYVNRLNTYHDDRWLASNTPPGQTTYQYEVANGYQSPLDANCLESFTRSRGQMTIPNENQWNNLEPEWRKDMRVPSITVPQQVRNDPSINDYNGRMRYNQSSSYGAFRY
jgi:hypothetical protein